MAHFVLVDAHVIINAVVLSDHVRSVTVNYGSEIQDDTGMSLLSRSKKGGLLDWSLDIEFFGDFAAGEVDATLFPLVGVGTTVEVRPTSAARSATNPGYTGTGILETYQPIGGEVGAMSMTTCTFQGSGTLTRATA